MRASHQALIAIFAGLRRPDGNGGSAVSLVWMPHQIQSSLNRKRSADSIRRSAGVSRFPLRIQTPIPTR